MRLLAVLRPRRGWPPLLLACSLGAAAAQVQADGDQPAVAGAAANYYMGQVTLESLSATRDRPLFSSVRRPPAPPLASEPPPPPPPPLPPDDKPNLTLLGTIRRAGGAGAAVVLDETEHKTVTMKAGDSRRGWVVQGVDASGVVLRKQDGVVQLGFPPPSRPLATPGQGIDD